MWRRETKTNLIRGIILSLVLIVSVLPRFGLATEYTSPNFKIKDPVFDIGQPSSSSGAFGLGQSVGQTAIGKSTSGGFQLWGGFQYYYKANQNTLTATPGDAQVDLSWTIPQTFLGISVSSYEVGVGTVSGTYAFQDVGSVTSYTQTGLSNGTPYFFKIKAKSPGGIFLVYSNEATATPNGATNTVPIVGGGGSPTTGASFSGFASPGATVFILLDGHVVGSVIAKSDGTFQATVTGISAGTYNFSLYDQDTNGLASSVTSLSVNVQNNGIVSAPMVILPPTIKGSNSQVKKGDDMVFSGQSTPGAKVTITFSSPLAGSHTVIADSNGLYFYTLNTSTLPYGLYYAKAQSTIPAGTSNFSLLVAFLVSTSTVITPAPGPCGDFNHDGRVNIVDFSILIYWYNSTNPPIDVDCNHDRIINLQDFSILMYNWTG